MLFLAVHSDKFTDQRAWPVVGGDMRADARARKADPFAVAERAVDVVVARHEDRVFSARARVDQRL